MSILVTGGAGYIGSHMVWKLVEQGEEVIVLDRLSTGFEWAVAPQAKLIIGDVGNKKLVREILRRHKVDAIIHFAGSIVVPDSVAEPLEYYNNNTSKARDLIEVAVEEDVRQFIFSSTAAVYGVNEGGAIDETATLAPASPYGHSKLMVEQMLADVSKAYDFRYSALRYFNVCGADPKGRTGQSTAGATHLIKIASETALGHRRSMELFGTDYDTHDGSCVRDYIHVCDLVDAHYLALQRLRNGGASLVANCGYGRGYSVREVIEAVRKVSGNDFAVVEQDRRAGDVPCIIADASCARKELGWVPRLDDLELIVKHALNWQSKLATMYQGTGMETPDPDQLEPLDHKVSLPQ